MQRKYPAFSTNVTFLSTIVIKIFRIAFFRFVDAALAMGIMNGI